MSNDNLDIWNEVCETDPKYTKTVAFGRKFTAIDPTYQAKIATKLWGAYGSGWGISQIKHSEITTDIVSGFIAVLEASFFFNKDREKSSFPLSVSVYPFSKSGKFDEDYRKKLETGLISKALARLGFSADVFLGKFDDVSYVQEAKKRVAVKDAVNDALESGDTNRLKKSLEHIVDKRLKDRVENAIKGVKDVQ